MNQPVRRKIKGLLCSVYRSRKSDPLSAIKGDKVVLVGEEIPELSTPSEEKPAVKVESRIYQNKEYLYVVPSERSPLSQYMMGGAFVWSTDSRFPALYPLPLHDRVEP